MGLGVGIFLIAVGAILTFAVNATSSSVNVDAVGWILMGVGLVSVLISLLFWQSWAGPGYWSRRRTTYVDDGDRKSTRLNSSHMSISYAVFCLKKKTAMRTSQSTGLKS